VFNTATRAQICSVLWRVDEGQLIVCGIARKQFQKPESFSLCPRSLGSLRMSAFRPFVI